MTVTLRLFVKVTVVTVNPPCRPLYVYSVKLQLPQVHVLTGGSKGWGLSNMAMQGGWARGNVHIEKTMQHEKTLYYRFWTTIENSGGWSITALESY